MSGPRAFFTSSRRALFTSDRSGEGSGTNTIPSAPCSAKRLAIAKESAARLAGLYDQTGFQQVYWSDKRWNHHEAMRSLAERTAVHPMTDVLPQDVPVEEFLIPGDGHPNARCHDMLAAYIVEHLLGPG